MRALRWSAAMFVFLLAVRVASAEDEHQLRLRLAESRGWISGAQEAALEKVATELGFKNPLKTLTSLQSHESSWAGVVRGFAREHELSEETADLLLRGWVDANWPVLDDALRRANGEPSVFALAATASAGDGRPDPATGPFLEHFAERVPQAARMLIALAPVGPDAPEMLLLAFERAPSQLPDIVAADVAPEAALLPIYDAALAPGGVPNDSTRRRAALAKLDVLLGAGLASEAVALVEQLPENVRAELLGAEAAHDDRTLQLAQAFLLAGRRAEATALLKILESRSDPMGEGASFAAKVLRAALERKSTPAEKLFATPDDRLLADQVALELASENPAATRELVARLGYEIGMQEAGRRHALPRSQRGSGTVGKAQRVLLAGLQARKDLVFKRFGISDPAASTVRRLLAMPRLEPCAEAASGGPGGTAPEWSRLEPRAPNGWQLIDAAAAGSRAVALYVSTKLDPLGTNARGGYWSATSNDAGRTWSKPVHTGLREPEVRLPDKETKPRLEGNRLVFAADVVDGQRPARLGEEGEPLYRRSALECSMPVLERDGDGDGLTDVVEEFLVTDPASRDTDGDGISDLEDMLPQVPAKGRAQPRGNFILHLLSDLDPWSFHGEFDPLAPATPFRPRSSGPLFVEAPRYELAGARTSERVVVLDPDEYAAAKHKFPRLFVRGFGSVEVNGTATEAKMDWENAFHGTRFTFTKRGREWSVKHQEIWIY